jgi:predicted outer membrane repeat protein
MKKIALLYLLLASCTCFANRIYVNPLATGLNNGTSWANAYKYLQYGLDGAQTGDTVCVAAGLYGNMGYSSNYTYRILRGGLTVLAGYPNTGSPTDAQRNWAINPTILSGEPVNFSSAYNLLLVSNIADPVVIDGFTLIKAYTTGLKIENSPSVVVKNTLFRDNSAQAIQVSNSQATFINCVLYNNQMTPVYNNTNATTGFYNCVIANNTGYSQVVKNEDASLALYNCTLVNNTGITVYGSGAGSTTVKNSIFWGNKSGYRFEDADIQSVNHTMQVSHCITQTYYDNTINSLLVNNQPRFLNQQQPAGADNLFFTADDGLQLTVPCSPALNYGDNGVLGAITTDIIGNPRIFNGGTVDLGAYEMQQAPGSHFNTVYVNAGAGNTGTHDGSSWTNAFTTLQQALLYCADTIKIAAGTYLTTNSYADSVFSLESGKVILGGYPATGNPTNADRNPKLYATILKGNYNTPSTGIYTPVIKAYHTDATTLLDGIRVTNWATSSGTNAFAVAVGYGSKLQIANCDFRIDATQDIRITGLSVNGASTPFVYRCEFNTGYSESGGVAAYSADQSHPTFSYCNFRGYAGSGGALAVSNASVTVDSCLFWKEVGQGDASFMSASNAVLTITNCLFRSYNYQVPLMTSNTNTTGIISNSVFRALSSDITIPAIYNDNSRLVFNKCLFDSSRLVMRNVNYAAPVLNNCVSVNGRLMWNKRSAPVVNNCTVVNTYFPRQSLDYSARAELVTNEDSTVFRANNTIFWSARLNPGVQDMSDQQNISNPQLSSVSILTNCLTQNYGTNGQNGNIVGKVPRFSRLDQITGPDGKLFTADDGLQLAVCSPAVNAGNSALGTIFATDVLGNPRIAQTGIDMGAYELQQAAGNTGTYYVNSAATGNNTGTSWNDAYTNLQSAICNACADTIRVAAGTYKPAVNNTDSTFEISRPLALYGGYPATGSPAAGNRDAVKYPTILSGNIGNPADSLDNTGLLVFVNGVTDSVHIDGFVIRDAYNTGSLAINAAGGAGMCILYSNAGVHNCQFINNHAFPFGGGLSITNASVSTVNRCIFINNSAANTGGALYAAGYLRLTGSVFEGNSAWGQGGAVYAGAGFDVSNSVFYRNYTTSTNTYGVGGGLYAAGGGNIYNCSFVENKASYALGRAGGGLSTNESLRIKTMNCIFSNNTAGSTTTSNGADLDWSGNYSLVFNCIFQYDRPYPLPAMRNKATDAGFVSPTDPKGPDGTWLTHDDGLQLTYSSAAVEWGQSEPIRNIPVDILGDARIALDSVDAGAYEYQNLPDAHAGADTLICAGDTVKIGRDGNPRHTYSWTSSPAGFTSASATPVVNPSVPTAYFVEVSNGTVIAHDTVQVSMSSSVTPAVTAATGNTTVCAGTPTIFTATPLYGGAHPSYQWRVNGNTAGTDSVVFSATVQNGDQVSVQLTSSASCASPATATSNVITMTVTPVAVPQVTISGPLSFCPGDTVTYKASSLDGGPRPLFKWVTGGVVAATTYDSSYTTSNISSQTNIYAMLFSNAVCQIKQGDTSNVLTVIPKSRVTPTVTVAASNTAICGVRPVTFTAQGYNGGTSPLWQWKLNGNNVGTNSNVYTNQAPANGDNVYVLMTSNADCPVAPVAQSNSVTMTVDQVVVPSIGITAPAEVKQDSSVVVIATVVNGNGAVTYLWQDSTSTHNWQTIPGAVTRTVNYAPHKTGDRIRCIAQAYTNCNDPVTIQSAFTFKVNTVTAIDPVAAANYGITSWPNPVTTYMVIDGLRLSDQWQILEVSGIDGRQKIQMQNISGKTQVVLGTDQLKAGVYIVTLRKKNGEMAYIKFVKL